MAGHEGERPGATVGPRVIGLGVHQAVEFLLGVFLVISSTRVTEAGAGVVLGFGVTLLVLPAVTAGPLAAVRLLPPAAHKLADIVLLMLALTSPLLPFDIEGNAVPLMVLAGLALALLTRATSYAVRRRRPRRPPAPAPAAEPPPAWPAAPTSTWARSLGTTAARARSQLPRQAGRMVGRLKKGSPPGTP